METVPVPYLEVIDDDAHRLVVDVGAVEPLAIPRSVIWSEDTAGRVLYVGSQYAERHNLGSNVELEDTKN